MVPVSSPEWTSQTKRTVALLFFGFIVLLAWEIRTIFPLVIVAALIAYILNPLVALLTTYVFIIGRDRDSRRGYATLFAFVFVLVSLIFILLVIVPELIAQLTEFGRSIPSWLGDVETVVTDRLSQPLVILGNEILIADEPFVPLDRMEEITGTRDLSELFLLDELNLGRAANAFYNSARNLSRPAFSFLGGAFNSLISTTFLLMMTYYLLDDGANFVDAAVSLIPDAYHDDAERVLTDVAAVWNAYLRGQLILSVVIGLVVYFAALSLGLPNPITLGLISGLLEFIPNLGPLIALIPAAFLALVSESTTISGLNGLPFMIVVIIVWTLIQNVEAVFIVPRVLGDSLELHPFVVIVSVMGGAAIGGALGVILAAPFVATGRVLARYVYGKLTGRSPFKIVNATDTTKEPPTIVARVVKKLWGWLKGWWRQRTEALRTTLEENE